MDEAILVIYSKLTDGLVSRNFNRVSEREPTSVV